MKIISRYTLRQLITGFVMVLMGMTILVWLTQSLRLVDMIVTKGVSVRIFLELTVLYLPNFLQVLIPLVLFAVALFTLIRMEADKELVVMQAVGMSPRDIMRPIFGMGWVLALIGYVFSFWVIPSANSELREMKWKIRNDISHLLLQEGQFNSVGNGLTLYIKERTSDGRIKGILAHEAKKPNQVSVLSAASGVIFQEPDGIRVEFYDGSRQEYNADTEKFSILKFDKHTMSFVDGGKEGGRTPDVRELTVAELWQKTEADMNGKMPLWRKHKVELVKRLVQPLYNITFLFLVALGVLKGSYNRRGRVGRINLVVGLAIIIQSMALGFENMAGKNLWFLIPLILNVLTPVVLYRYGKCPAWLKMLPYRLIKKIGVVVVVTLLLGAGKVLADNGINLKVAPVNTKTPVDFEADKVSYNQKKNEVYAEGQVVLVQDGLKVETNKITYNKTENKITAPDKIKITHKDGTVAQTRDGVLSGDLSAIKAGKTDVLFYEGSFLGADRMERQENGDSYLTEAVYTPCDRCEDTAPLWRLRSKSVWNDVQNHDLVFKHSFFEVKDTPILYLPYWRMPDFTVKRRSGFLVPSIGSSREMKRTISLPYFFNLADNQNLVVTPVISVDHFPMGLLDYSGMFSRGSLKLALSGTRDRGGDHGRQGHIRTSFDYDISSDWKMSGELYKVSTDTYFRRYRIPRVDDKEPFLTSYLTTERFGNRNYFRLKTYSFQSLEDGVNSHSIPILLPVMEYRYNSGPLMDNGLYAFSSINAMMFNTREHFKSNRLSLTQGVKLPYVGSWGGAIDLEASVRADGYAVDTGNQKIADKPTNDSYNTGRIYPILSATMRYPFVKSDEQTTQILEPIAMLVVSSNGGNKEEIPNVDSLVFDFDDTDLFSSNRFSGYDRVEPGQRINYGIKWSRFNHKTKQSISALVGQSYRFDDDELMADLMGYDTHFSNYVGRVQMSLPYMNFMYRARLDQRTLQARKNDISISVGEAPLKLGIEYVMRKSYRIGKNRYSGRQEIIYKASSKLTKSLSVSGYYRYNLSGKGKPVEAGGSLKYENECTALTLDVDKSYTKDRDYTGSFSFMLKVVLKTLGGM